MIIIKVHIFYLFFFHFYSVNFHYQWCFVCCTEQTREHRGGERELRNVWKKNLNWNVTNKNRNWNDIKIHAVFSLYFDSQESESEFMIFSFVSSFKNRSKINMTHQYTQRLLRDIEIILKNVINEWPSSSSSSVCKCVVSWIIILLKIRDSMMIQTNKFNDHKHKHHKQKQNNSKKKIKQPFMPKSW